MSARLRKLLQATIILLIILNAVELGLSLKFRKTAQLYHAGDMFPKPSGYLANGEFVQTPAAHCYVLRVSSDNCGFCRLDEAQYLELLEHARKRGCEGIILAPKREQLKSGEMGDVSQLQYIDYSFGRSLVPYATPETILLDRSGHIAWFEEGAMDQGGLSQALTALNWASD